MVMIVRCNKNRKDGHLNDIQLQLLAICSETPKYVIAEELSRGCALLAA